MALAIRILAAIILLIVINNGGLASYWDFFSLTIVVIFGAVAALVLKMILKKRINSDKVLSVSFLIAGTIGFIWITFFYVLRNQMHLAYQITLIPILYGVIFSTLISIFTLIRNKRRVNRRNI